MAATSFDPIRCVPPITTIFISVPFDFVMTDACWLSARKVDEVGRIDRSGTAHLRRRQLLERQVLRRRLDAALTWRRTRLALLLGGSSPLVVEANGLRGCPGR